MISYFLVFFVLAGFNLARLAWGDMKELLADQRISSLMMGVVLCLYFLEGRIIELLVVGFIALFGIATNDGVIMGTYIHQVFERKNPSTVFEVQEAVVEAGKKRVRPAMMTAAVAIIALLPVLTSTGKGADIMVPMAIPTFGGMIIQMMTMFVVPVLQAIWRENAVRRRTRDVRRKT